MCVLQSKQKIELVNRDSKPENDFLFQTNNNIKTTHNTLSVILYSLRNTKSSTFKQPDNDGFFKLIKYVLPFHQFFFSCLTKAVNEFLLHHNITLYFIYIYYIIMYYMHYNVIIYNITICTQVRQKYDYFLLMLLLVGHDRYSYEIQRIIIFIFRDEMDPTLCSYLHSFR